MNTQYLLTRNAFLYQKEYHQARRDELQNLFPAQKRYSVKLRVRKPILEKLAPSLADGLLSLGHKLKEQYQNL